MLMLTLVVTVARSFYVFAALTIMLISYALIGVVLFHNVSWGQAIDRSVLQDVVQSQIFVNRFYCSFAGRSLCVFF